MNMEGQNDATNEWNKEMQRENKVQKYPKWPNEAMLKVLFGGTNYLKAPFKPQPEWRVLDVGCFFANNLVPFADIGCECHGVDLHSEMAAMAQEVMDRRGFKTCIQAGANRSLPYPDAHFDLVLSINTLHYEGIEENVLAALKEFRRVLKPGGGLYLSTVGPEHEIYKRAETLGHHRYRVQDYDFRNGQEFFFFDNERYLQHYCQQVFGNVETGRVTEKLMKLPLDFLIALCR
ncbi:MAG: class I SAM-dependent methyltransferase [Nitrospira sp.]